MIDIARRAINAHSYEELQQVYEQDWGIEISDDQIRLVVNELGRIVHNYDTAVKDDAMRILICVNGVLKHVNTPDSYLRERCANIVDSVRSLA